MTQTLERETQPAPNIDERDNARLVTNCNAPLRGDLVSRLARVPLFSSLQVEQLGCLDFVSRGEIVHLEAGERLVKEDDAAAFYIVLEGDLHVLKKDDHGDEALIATHRSGTFFGEVPLLLGTGFVAAGQAVEAAQVFRLDEDAFWQMLSLCPTVTKTVLRTMAQRVQNLESIAQGRERLASLGTMAAGLAHELNNPAAASVRASRELRQTARTLPLAACRYNKQHLPPEALDYLAKLQRELAERPTDLVPLDTLTQSDRENDITDWLDARDVPDAWKHAAVLVDAGITVEWLETLSEKVPATSLDATLNWIGATLAVDHLVGDIERSNERISDLVKQVKTYSHMDQSPLQQVDVHEELESTLTLLGHKMRDAKIEIVRDYNRELPRFCAYGSELNQVWTNLLDNAADALSEQSGKRQITIATRIENEQAVIKITDNGGGIEKEVRKNIFEPFFTTKEVGKGTGLGLGISHRIITARHHGQIDVESEPGQTCFVVRLPLDLEAHPDISRQSARKA